MWLLNKLPATILNLLSNEIWIIIILVLTDTTHTPSLHVKRKSLFLEVYLVVLTASLETWIPTILYTVFIFQFTAELLEEKCQPPHPWLQRLVHWVW